MTEEKIYETEIISIDPEHIAQAAIDRAGKLIAEGELVAFPTETVYGLGGDAMNREASRRIYEAKGRPSDNPLIVHIAELADLERVAAEVPERALRLAEAFWPGPLTMIMKKGPNIPETTTGGMDTVAIRMPNHPVALTLIKSSGCVIAAPSANASGRPSPTCAGHVAQDLTGRISMILDGGPVGIGIESTIIDLTEKRPMILRPGYITTEMLAEVLGEEVGIDPAIVSGNVDPEVKPKAPGMKYRHYAPKGDMVIVDGEQQSVVDAINCRIEEDHRRGKKVVVIAAEETKPQYRADAVLSTGEREDEDAIARHLYGILRECDSLEADVIYSESFSTPRIGQAIMNRLLKAAGHQVIHIS